MRDSLVFLCILIATTTSLLAQAALRPGDTVEIRISGVPADEQTQFNGTLTVDGRGMLNISYIGEVRAAGYRPAEVAARIENNLRVAQIYTNPTISLQPPVGTLSVNVNGAVKLPQRVTYTPDMTLTIAINAAGGLNDFASPKGIRLTRDGKSTEWDLRDIRRRPSTDPKLQPGDSIEVFQSIF
jgi:protein involved in polysaccharide export with SLBB domain